MGFPQLSNIAKEFYDTINSKAGNNQLASSLIPWIRVTSTLGDYLSLESIIGTQSFSQKYGNSTQSGRVGVNKRGEDLIVDIDRGFRPSPTISEISVNQGNEGLSKKITFTITAYSVGQSEILMEYFLEPANMVLVEWGHNVNDSIQQKTTLDKCSILEYNNLNFIQKKRAQSKGTYDAILGTITGGNVKFGSNETYEINVELTTIGELPAYLQHHKSIQANSQKIGDTSLTYQTRTIDNAADEDDFGRALFMQMYNDLPANKRTKKLQDEIETEDGRWMIDPTNYINIDKEIREDLVKGLSGVGAKISVDGESFDVPADKPLFSEKRFIRCRLAFEILDFQPSVVIESKKIEGCPKSSSSSGKINWKKTICRAHPHIFSTNSDFLYIPNKRAPKFDLKGALSVSTDENGNQIPFKNPIPSYESLETKDGVQDLMPEGINKSYFPAQEDLMISDQKSFDNTYLEFDCPKETYGYLSDLYINYDFFLDCINSSGLVTKEVWYKILNGLSSAVNLYWDFQIVPRGAITSFNQSGNEGIDAFYKSWRNSIQQVPGDEELQIVDLNFIGRNSGGAGRAKFQSRGTRTPFLDCSFDLDIPGAMKGQIIGNKLSNGVSNPSPEQNELTIKSLFTDKKDEIVEALNSIKKEEEEEETREQEIESIMEELKTTDRGYAERIYEKRQREEQDTDNDEQRKSNYEFFAQMATVVPRFQDRSKNRDIKKEWYDKWSLNDADVGEMAVVAAWNDTALLKKVQRYDEDRIVEQTKGQFNLPLLPIKFSFTIHGVSGLRVGDTFNINDLPLQYKKKVFQVVEVAHTISQNIWTTQVTGQLRNMDASNDDPIQFSGTT